jgi:CBS domain-containing protein
MAKTKGKKKHAVKAKAKRKGLKGFKMKGAGSADEDEEEKELRIMRPMGQRITSRLTSSEDVRNTPVTAVMKKGVIVLDSSKTVIDAARLMKRNFIGSIIIVEKGKAVGIITERDIVREIVAERKDPATPLRKAMSTPIRVATEDKTVQEAIAMMRKYRIKKLPILDSQMRLIGIVTETDIARAAPGLLDLAMELTNILRFESETMGAGKLSEEEQEEEYGRYGEGTEGHRETE